MTDLQKHFPFTLNQGQNETCNSLIDFLENPEQKVFVLAGYAGTGKTTILKGVLNYLDEKKAKYGLLASTGRAAKVMATLTGRITKTIHSTIYMLDENASKLDEDNKTLAFKLKENMDDKETIYFIDESSMIADKSEANPFLLFDDGRFLEHLFTYLDERKVVFIGDAAQLPPINCSFSAALDTAYIQKTYGKKCSATLLTEVMRQQLESGILWNATELRKHHDADPPPPLAIKSSFEDIRVENNVWSALDDFVIDMKQNGAGNSTFISFTNGGVHYLNTQIRNKFYRAKDPPLHKGEYLMVVQNNYLHELVNGHHVLLEDFDQSPIIQGKLSFLNATIKIPEADKRLKVKIIKELLFRKEPSLTVNEEQDLMKNFVLRMKYKGLKPKTEEFHRHFIFDGFLNALRVKFGYAVTCHKAQGGEWKRAYVNFEPMLDNIPRKNLYRWTYTAITRASSELVIPKHKYLY